ncbi:MAG: hypothetical protein O3A00_24260 [Planctomycetota bacterium]|nr:hypothetical protein [Planctomycetota bacterium]
MALNALRRVPAVVIVPSVLNTVTCEPSGADVLNVTTLDVEPSATTLPTFTPAVTAVGSRESGASHSAGPPDQSDGRCWVSCCCQRRAGKSSGQQLVAGDNLGRLSLWPVAHSAPTTSGRMETEDRGHAVTRAPPFASLRR